MLGRLALKSTLLMLVFTSSAVAQQDAPSTNWSPRFFLDADIGTRGEIGFIPPSSDFGASFELPTWKRLELQGAASFSPDKKQITHSGHSIDIAETQLFWVTSRFGLSAEVQYHSLWTSQFLKQGWHSYPGIAVRTTYFAPGRLYASIAIPTGCVWATPGNPCLLQSNRLVGPLFTQEWQIHPRIRINLQATVVHFCDQSNQNEPSIRRVCHWAGTEMVGIRFQFPPWKSDAMY